MTNRERTAFALAGFGQNLVLNFVGLYLLIYLVHGVGLSTAGIAAVTVIMTLAKIWDAVADLGIGVLVDHTHTRWGRYRPYLAGTALPVACLTVALFSLPRASETLQLVFFGVAFVLFATLYTLGDVPYWALAAASASDDAERTLTIAGARSAGVLGLAVITLAGTPLAHVLSFGPTTSAAGWQRAALVVAVVGMGLFALASLAHERAATTATVRPADSLHQLVSDRPLLLLLASGVLGFGRNVMAVGGALLALVVFGDETLFTLLGAALIVGMLLATITAPIWLSVFSRKTVMLASTMAGAALFLALWFVGYGELTRVLPLIGLTGYTLGLFMVVQTAMIADVADYGEARTGVRHDGVCFAGLTFAAKVTLALATAAFGASIAAIGYQSGSDVTPAMRDGIWATCTLLPAASNLVSLLPLLAYRVPERTGHRAPAA